MDLIPALNEPWWKDGLRFKCRGCGRCCTGGSGAIWVLEEEVTAISGYLEITETEFREKYMTRIWGGDSIREKENGDCLFYDRSVKGCIIYPVRPLQCRLFPFWSSILSSKREWDIEAQTCPGINEGTLFERESIEDFIRKSRKVSIFL